MDVLVTGATGFVGSRLVPALLAADHSVRVLVRDADSYDGPDAVRVYEGDLLDPGSFDDALAGSDAAYYLVHSMGTGGDFEERDRRAARNFAESASEATVERVVYLGGLGEDDADLSKHLRSRREVESVLDDGDYDLTTLRAAVIIGDGSVSFAIIYQLATRLPVMVTPRWVHNECQPIAIDDVVAYLAGVLDAPATADGTFQIGGPDVLPYRDILTRTASLAGHREPFIVPVPVLSPGLSARWIGLVTDVDPAVAKPLIDGLRTPVVVTDDAITDHVDVDLISFDDAVAQALASREETASPGETR